MKAYLTKCLIGVLAFNQKGELVNYKLFQKNPESIAKALSNFSSEEKEVLDNLKNLNYNEIITDLDIEYKGLKISKEKDNIASKKTRENLRTLAKDLQFCDPKELNKILSQVNINLTKEKIKKQKRDKILIQVIGVIGELDKSINTLSERLVEWYGLHFPELQRKLNSNEKYSSIVSKYGLKDNIKDSNLRELAEKSSGIEFSNQDEENIKIYAEEINNLFGLRKKLTKYVEKLSKEIIPNTSEIAGSLLGSKLVQLAGGVDKLARLPSSTLQLIGAEKALFRHMKGQGKAPKYGIIYQHPLIQNGKKEKRGKIARLIASKLTLAARLDAYSDKDKGKELRKELEDAVKKL